MSLWQRIQLLFGRKRFERELDDELRFHLDAQVETSLRAGLSPPEARRQAMLELGGMEQVKEQVRQARPGFWLETLWQDARFGARMLRKNPGFTAVAVLTLALGIGANTAIFSVVHAVLLAPLPYPQADRLVRLTEPFRTSDWNVSYPNFLDWRARSRTLEGLAIYNPYRAALLTGGERAEMLSAAIAEAALFRLFDVHPAAGRIFTADEERPGAERVVMISHSLWVRRFGKDPSIVGRTITLNLGRATVVGVLPPGFEISRADVWYPLVPALGPNELDRGNHGGFGAFARLRPGVRLEQAQEEMAAIAKSLERAHPATNTDFSVRVTPLLDSMVRGVRTTLLVLFGAVGFVLMIACANVANVLLARAVGRSREVALRAALGASAARIFRLFLSESLLLSLLGAAAGVTLAAWGVDALLALEPHAVPRAAGVGIHTPVLLYALGAALVCGVLFGTAPAWQATRVNLVKSLKHGSRGTQGSERRSRLRWGLVMAQVVLSVVLLVGAGLMVRTLAFLSEVDPGFRPDSLLLMNLSLPSMKYSEEKQVTGFTSRAMEEVRGLPGIETVAEVWPFSLEGPSWTPMVQFEEDPRPAGQEPVVQAASAGVDYFDAMRIPLRAGRTFRASDRPGAPAVAVVNEEFARRFFPGESPLGKHVRMAGAVGVTDWTEIVGVVGNTLRTGLGSRFQPELYWPFAQFPIAQPTLVVRSSIAPSAVAMALRDRVAKLDPDVVVDNPRPVEAVLNATVSDRRFTQRMLAVFASLALTLAAMGIYSVTAYLAAQRTQEIGVRMALGASRRDILRLICGQGIAPVVLGVALGLGGAIWVTRFLAHQLFGVRPLDPVTFGSVALLLLVVALLACYIPARRATRVDPMVALRYE